MKLLDRLFKKQPEIEFRAVLGNAAICTPVVAAKSVRVDWMKKQSKNARFQMCPGMMDYASSGYIVSAHTDIHIKANKTGTKVIIDRFAKSKETQDILQMQKFEYKVVEGMVEIEPSVLNGAYKIPLPWIVKTKPGYSAYVMPALMHFPFNDKLFVYPGVVDYDKFPIINFVFSPMKECEFTIPVGTPLLHILPFKREVINANCDVGQNRDIDRFFYTIVGSTKNFYRRFLSEKKTFKMECPYEHIKHKD